jgi:hypothetical protein
VPGERGADDGFAEKKSIGYGRNCEVGRGGGARVGMGGVGTKGRRRLAQKAGLNDSPPFVNKNQVRGCDQSRIYAMSEAVNPKAYPLADAQVRSRKFIRGMQSMCESECRQLN